MIQPGRAIRVMVCAVSAGVLACGATTAATGDRARAESEVDLYLLRGDAALVPGGAADRAMTVINHGGDMTGDVELYYTTPIFINIDEEKGMPPGCAMYHRNKDFHIPEIVKCTLGPLKAEEKHEVSFPIKIFDGAPARPTYGTAIARPAQPDADKERNIIDNIARPGGTIALPPTALARRTGPRVVALHNTALVSKEPSMSEYRVHNNGDATAENVRLVVVTPLYVNTSTAGSLPKDCSMVLTDPDPAVPEIVECAVGAVEPGESRNIQIPVKAVPNGPLGEVYGAAVTTTVAPESATRTAGPDVRGRLKDGGVSSSREELNDDGTL